ncbi:hypothetical protein I3760_02G010200 [Carya illinoinensis]|nr:hypothetical protein I3760_02G010200 [Carya illinoinensis]
MPSFVESSVASVTGDKFQWQVRRGLDLCGKLQSSKLPSLELCPISFQWLSLPATYGSRSIMAGGATRWRSAGDRGCRRTVWWLPKNKDEAEVPALVRKPMSPNPRKANENSKRKRSTTSLINDKRKMKKLERKRT